MTTTRQDDPVAAHRSPLRSVAGFSVRHRWLVITGWLLLVAMAVLGKNLAGGSFANDLSVSGTDSQAAHETMQQQFPSLSGDPMQVVIRTDRGLEDPTVRPVVESALADIAAGPDVAVVTSPYRPGGTVSTDGTAAIVTVVFDQSAKDIPPTSVEAAQAAALEIADTGAQVEFGGPAATAESGPSGSEVIGLIAAMVVLLLAFGSLYAMVVPIVTALFALAFGLSVVGLLSAWIPIGTSAPVVAAMIGLGVGIDYALLIVTRHREGMITGHEPRESIQTAVGTAGRSVLVAGSTVMVALLSLFLIGIPFVSALGLASAITVAATMLAAVTLLPALLAVFGGKLDRLRVRRPRFDHADDHGSGWHRWTRRIQRRPWPYLVSATAVLLILAAPLLSIRLGSSDGGSAPSDSTARRSYDIVAAGVRPRLDRPAAGHCRVPQRHLAGAGPGLARRAAHRPGRHPGSREPCPAPPSTPAAPPASSTSSRSGRRRTPPPRTWSTGCAPTCCHRPRGSPTWAVPPRPPSTWPTGSLIGCSGSSASSSC